MHPRLSPPTLSSLRWLLVASITLNVALGWRLFSGWQGQRPPTPLAVGASASTITAEQHGVGRSVLRFDDIQHPTVLYVFTPSCVWCARNMGSLKALVAQTIGRFRFVGISLSEERLTEYIRTNDFSFAVYSQLDPATVQSYRLNSTPTTIAVSPQGKVLAVWGGAFAGPTKVEVEEFFSVRLPEIELGKPKRNFVAPEPK